MKSRTNVVAVLLLVLLVVLSGCFRSKKVIEKEVEKETGFKIKKDNVYEYKDKYGNVIKIEITNKKLPKSFPKTFPVLKNSILINGYKRTFKNIKSYSAHWESKRSLDYIKNEYLNKLKELGWSNVVEKEVLYDNKKEILIIFEKGTYIGNITLSYTGELKPILIYGFLGTEK